MKLTKPIFLLIASLAAALILIPALLVLPFQEAKPSPSAAQPAAVVPLPESSVEVAVYRSASKQVETVPLELYIVGVVAAEMPVNFEMEALKAQALTARTFVVKRMLGDKLPTNADVDDTIATQVYKDEKQLQELWGKEYEAKRSRIEEAVRATAGQVLTFGGELITASFFSTSNGYTENSEDYWGGQAPYLRSVESPWDSDSPKFATETKFTVAELQQKLGVTINNDGTVGTIAERTSGQRVKTVHFNGKTLTGREVREKLGLYSSDFTWKQTGNKIIVTTKGYGHGVGMSQYGANGMAKEGKSYKDIVTHYYQGVKITSVNEYEQKITARK